MSTERIGGGNNTQKSSFWFFIVLVEGEVNGEYEVRKSS